MSQALTLNTLQSLLTTVDRDRRKGTITQTQAERDYNLGRELMSNAVPRKSVAKTYEEHIDVDDFPEGLREAALYGTDAPVKGTPPIVMSASLAVLENQNEVYDLREVAAARRAGTRIVDYMNGQETKNLRSVARDLENFQLIKPAKTSGAPKISGLLEHLRGTHNSSGTVVAQPVPDFTGVYAIRADSGTADANYQGRSRLTTPRLANLAATYTPDADPAAIADLVKVCANRMAFTPSPIMRQGRTVGDTVVFCPRSFYERYSNYINVNAGDRRGTDLEAMDGERIGRMRLVQAEALDNEPLRNLIGVKLSRLQWLYLEGFWMNRNGPHQKANAHNVLYYAMDHICQLWAENPRELGFNIHRTVAA